MPFFSSLLFLHPWRWLPNTYTVNKSSVNFPTLLHLYFLDHCLCPCKLGSSRHWREISLGKESDLQCLHREGLLEELHTRSLEVQPWVCRGWVGSYSFGASLVIWLWKPIPLFHFVNLSSYFNMRTWICTSKDSSKDDHPSPGEWGQ